MKRIWATALAIMAIMMSPFTVSAEDTDMYGGDSTSLAPNVLIIFDNSGSMDDSILVGENYNPSTIYTCASCTYDRTDVYYQYSSGWYYFADIGSNGIVDSSEISCSSARDNLNTDGEWGGNIKWSSPHGCGGSSYYLLRTGNYLNYMKAVAPVYRKKIDIAKEKIISVIKNTPLNIRWGLMVFNYDEGGYVVSAVKDRGLNRYYNYPTYLSIPEEDRSGFTEAEWIATQSLFKTDLIDKINTQTASTWTPLAETLAEAGRYFAGAAPYYGKITAADSAAFTSSTKTQYYSPIDYRCRSNNVIIITDGMPTQDKGALLTTSTYLNGKAIGDYDKDGCDPNGCVSGTYTDNGSDYLDDVAGFLYKEDLILRSSGRTDAAGVSYGTYGTSPDMATSNWQHVNTYAIGFNVDTEILRDACDNGQGKERDSGNGMYFTTNEDIGLDSALRIILSDIVAKNSCYTAPVVPISRANKTYAGNSLYIGIFSPVEAIPGFWRGNLKKFGFKNTSGETNEREVLLDRYANPVVIDGDGLISNSVLTAWYLENPPSDGLQVNYGGVGKVLYNGNSGHARTFKTRKAGGGLIEFNKTNISPEDLNFASGDTVKRNDLIDWIRAEGIYATNSGNSRSRTWLLGDVLHSRPAILFDDVNNTNVLFVGSNDGFLHCFVDNEGNDGSAINLQNDTIYEAWSFTPWELVSKLKNIPPENTLLEVAGDGSHDIYVDGSPLVYSTNNKKFVAFGLRRGGKSYYSLNVTDYTNPAWGWEVPDSILGTETLGESWSTPLFATIKKADGSTQNVILLAGGYDTNEDLSNPGSGYVSGCTNCDKTGKAIFGVDAENGTLVNSVTFTYSSYNKLNTSIIDLIAYDDNDDGYDDVIYAVALGGDVFAFNDLDGDGTWNARWLFHAAQDGSTSKKRKLFYSPGIAQESWGDWVYVGSGDREDPLDDSGSNIVSNRLYAVKNKWKIAPWNTTWVDGITDDTLTDSDTADFVDVTSDILQSTTATDSEKAAVLSDLEAKTGWYITLENSGEKVVSPIIVYDRVAYFTTYQPTTGASSDPCTSSATGVGRVYAVNYKNGNAVYDSNNDGSQTKSDRVVVTGKGMAAEPKIVITPDQTYVVVSMEGIINVIKVAGNREVHRYYWQQQ
jgi:type IV pilus assembly protein PilY1